MGRFGLYEEPPEKQNAQDHQDGNDDDFYQAQSEFLD